MANPQLRSTKDLFEDMGSKVASASQNISDDETKVVDEIESLCMNCHEDGVTKLLLTRIPFFREIIIMSFECPHCGLRNSEVQPAGEIQQRGHKYTFKVDSKEDLNRQLVKSDTCVFRLEDEDLEIPPGRGQLTNLEGILSMISQDLEEGQEDRKGVAPIMYDRIEEIITSLKSMAAGDKLPFTLTINDPAGNSWIEPSTTDKSGKYVRHDYNRTPAQNEALGLGSGDAAPQAETNGDAATNGVSMRPEYHPGSMYPAMPTDTTQLDQDAADDIIENQVYSFPATCPGCTKPCATNMKMVNIPHFKQVVLMSTVCDHCGYRSNEVKTGGEIPEKGRKIVVDIRTKEDLSRDILKSESCAMSCPELELSVEPGTLGGRFTTIEGLLTQVRDDLKSSIFDADAGGGDSMPSDEKSRWAAFFGKLDKAVDGDLPFTLALTDPLASSYVQSFTAPEPDPQIQVEEYERTEEEEEDLGLRDIKVEGYEEDEKKDENAEDDMEKAKKFLEKTTGLSLEDKAEEAAKPAAES
jgi:zinc finger protein